MAVVYWKIQMARKTNTTVKAPAKAARSFQRSWMRLPRKRGYDVAGGGGATHGGGVSAPTSIAMPLLPLDWPQPYRAAGASGSGYRSPSRSSRSRAPVLPLRCRTADSDAVVIADGAVLGQQGDGRGEGRGVDAGEPLLQGSARARSDAEQRLDDQALDGASVEQAAQPGSDGLAAQRPDHAVVEGEGVLGSHLTGRESQVTAVVAGTEDRDALGARVSRRGGDLDVAGDDEQDAVRR